MQTVVIGRSSEADYRVDHETVSRRHAVLVITSETMMEISDSDSRNGLFVQEDGAWMRVRSARVRANDQVRLGDAAVSIADILADIARKPTGGSGRAAARPSAPAADIRRPGAAAGGGPDDPPLERFRRPRRNPETGEIEEGY